MINSFLQALHAFWLEWKRSEHFRKSLTKDPFK